MIKSATFVKSGTTIEHYPEANLPEILLVGRSNVGKSTFINTVLNRKNLAHTSGKPGKTQTLNFYLVNDAFHFVDVPGYGYAKVSKSQRQQFATMIDEYLQNRDQLRLVIQLVDFRHPPSKDDLIMLHYLHEYDIPVIVIGTKCDKIPKTKRQKQEKDIMNTLGIDQESFLPFSATEQINLDVVYDLIEQVLEGSE